MSKQERLEKKILHYTGKAIADYKMISHEDRLLVCLSGGKDSWTLTWALRELQKRAKINFDMQVLTVDQGQPGWDDNQLKQYLTQQKIKFEVIHQNTYDIVKEKIPENKTYCSLCSRLRRGIIYRYARENGFNKVVLGHHRDDCITTLLMSILYNGAVKSMPPKLLNDAKDVIVIRPLVYCQEADIAQFSLLKEFPIIPCNLCGSQENLQRQSIKGLIHKMAKTNPKIPSNILSALSNVRPTQLMDKNLWNFADLEQQMIGQTRDCHETTE